MARTLAILFSFAVTVAGSSFGGEARTRSVDGIPVPPFGYSLESNPDGGFVPSDGFLFPRLAAWPERLESKDKPPLTASPPASGPNKRSAGREWVERINQWYREGTAAGLSQDTFRSFDNGHSGIPLNNYPQMQSVAPVAAFGSLWENIFLPRVTMGVQSYGVEGKSVIEDRSRRMLRAFYESNATRPAFQRPYRAFYENNFLFVAPAVGSYKAEADTFAFLSPFYVHSIGASGSDSRLLKPLVLASAAFPPELKTRMLRLGLFVPTMMYLFKSSIADDIKSPAAHVPAYALPAEAADGFEGPTPFLDNLLNSAHNLIHIPPVCRMKLLDVAIEGGEGHDYGGEAYWEDSIYGFTAALREGQSLVLKVDLRYSWTDHNLPIEKYHVSLLRGKGTIEFLNKEKSKLMVRIPWSPTDTRRDFRTDILLLVHDGTYYSAPAYISLRHINKLDPIVTGIKVRR